MTNIIFFAITALAVLVVNDILTNPGVRKAHPEVQYCSFDQLILYADSYALLTWRKS